MTTDFAPLSPRPETLSSGIDYGRRRPASALSRLVNGALDRMHRHVTGRCRTVPHEKMPPEE